MIALPRRSDPAAANCSPFGYGSRPPRSVDTALRFLDERVVRAQTAARARIPSKPFEQPASGRITEQPSLHRVGQQCDESRAKCGNVARWREVTRDPVDDELCEASDVARNDGCCTRHGF